MLMEKMTFIARDGAKLSYDKFNATEHKATMIFLHGSTYNSRRYASIAKALCAQSYNSCLLNWRGHGSYNDKTGDLDYIGQLEDDLADFISHYQQSNDQPIVLGGHSAGAVICLRYIAKYGCDNIDAVNFIAPAINGPLETVRYQQASASWQYRINHFRAAQPITLAPEAALQHAPTLKMWPFWIAKLLPFMRHKTILTFPASERMAKLEGRTLNYSYNMMLSCDINNYPAAFNQINVPVLLLAGQLDEVLHPDLLSTIYHWHLSAKINKQLIELPNVNHMGVVPAARKILPDWLSSIFPDTSQQTKTDGKGEIAC